MKNANQLLQFDQAHAGLSPSRYQADSYPQPFRSRIQVVHDGIDTDALAPAAGASLTIGGVNGDREAQSWVLEQGAHIVSFAARHFEPLRGCHVFMRALPALLSQRPDAWVVMVGGDGVAYGQPEPTGRGWRARFWAEVQPQLTPEQRGRVLFAPPLPRDDFTRLLQVTAVHVVLSYPFVVSWSVLEAMSCGAAVVASDTVPVREFIQPAQHGDLVDFFDRDALVRAIGARLDDAPGRRQLGQAARDHVREHYDLRTRCLPRQIEWVQRLVQSGMVQKP